MPSQSARPTWFRSVPLVYLAMALVLAVLVLPTALRPPPDQQSATASFSPDAPPDEAPELLIQSVRKAQSSTAGATATAEEIAFEEPPPPPPPPPPRKAARGRCFGDPPRQTESLYSALCVPAWTGADNGGKTWNGVYPNEIRIGVVVGESSSVPEGFLEHEFRETDTESMHHLKVWQAYFNDRFELYGRRIRFFVAKQSITDEDQQRASVRKMKYEGDVFAIVADGYGQAAAAMEEATRLGIVDFGSIGPDCAFYKDNHPYAFSFQMDGCKMHRFLIELSCKQFAGKPPGLLNERRDPLFDYNAPRKWGLVIYQDESRKGGVQTYTELLARCGITLERVAEYNLTSNQQAIAGIMAKMREGGVTTVIMYVDVIVPIALTQEASRLQYYPEYVQIGLSLNGTGRNLDDDQVKHMVGVHTGEIARVSADTDPYRAYKEIDPEGDPDSSYFRSLQQLVGGMQHAGPNLTPETLWQGLLKQPQRRPDPEWSIGGGYAAPDDFTYMDYVSLTWFDQKGDDPNSSSAGAWRHVWNGRRYALGELPTEEIPWFDPEQAIDQPERGVQG